MTSTLKGSWFVNNVEVPADRELLWAPPVSAGRRAGRRPLSREQIVTAGVAIADGEGLEAVSMPRLARSLDTAPMSLYRHVPDKDALVGLMLDAAIGPPPEAIDTAGSWRERLAAWARSNLEVFRRHPWTLPLVSGTRAMGPHECAWGEAALRAIGAAGLGPPDNGRVLMLVNGYVRGAAVPVGERVPDLVTLEHSGRAAELPLIAALLATRPAAPAEESSEGGGAGALTEDAFEFGLLRVLDGVEARLPRSE